MLCILRHLGVQLRLAYSWARPAILAAGKNGGNVLFSSVSSFSSVSPLSLSFISPTILSISLLPFSRRQHKMTHKGLRVDKPQHHHLNTLWNTFMILGRNVEQDEATCHIQEWLSHFWSCLPFMCFNLILCPLFNKNTLQNILMILGRNVEQHEMSCCLQE